MIHNEEKILKTNSEMKQMRELQEHYHCDKTKYIWYVQEAKEKIEHVKQTENIKTETELLRMKITISKIKNMSDGINRRLDTA